jgi:hypothetical protein
MANLTTKIIYDVSEAIKNLKKLDKQAKKTGDSTEDAFDGGADSLKDFEGALTKVNPKLGGFASNITKIAAAAGPMGVAVGAAAAAGVALVGAFAPLPDIMRDNVAMMQLFADQSQSILDQQNRISSIQDAQRSRFFRDLKDQVQQRRSQLDAERADVNEGKLEAENRVRDNKSALRQIENDLKASIKRRKDIRKQLEEGVIDAAVAGTGAGKTQGGRINELAFQAEKAAREGNLELARALTDEAKKLTQEQGNHVFFLKQIAGAEEAIKQKLKDQDAAEAKLGAKLKAKKSRLEENLKIAEKEKREAEERLRILEQESSRVGSVAKAGKVAGRVELDSQKAGEASREQVNELKIIQNILREGRSGFTNLGRAGAFALDFLNPTQGRSVKDLTEDSKFVESSKNAIVGGIRDAFKDGRLTIAEIEGLNKLVEAQETQAREIKSRRPGGELAGFVRGEEKVLENFQTAIKKLGDAAGKGGEAGIKEDQDIQIQAQQIEVKANQLRADVQQQQRRVLPQNGTAAPPAAAPAANQGAAATTINFNMKVEGGMIDEATLQQFDDRVKRLLREEKISPQNVA